MHEPLSVEDDIEVVGEAGTAADAPTRIPATRPGVAVVDVRLPDGSGVLDRFGSAPRSVAGVPFDPIHLRVEPQFATVHSVIETDGP